jgi:hypothetical protein
MVRETINSIVRLRDAVPPNRNCRTMKVIDRRLQRLWAHFVPPSSIRNRQRYLVLTLQPLLPMDILGPTE